jgi:K+-sensing histidine kinase KdpD
VQTYPLLSADPVCIMGVMFLRSTTRKKNGKEHRYWSIVENKRCAGDRVVQDQGPGVPLALRPQLFVEFAKVGNRPTGGETSTGLGLFIVKTLAEAQGSKMGAEFPPEGGSIFWFDAPSLESVSRVAR